MSNIENQIKILLNLFNSAKFDILISKAKKLIKKAPEYLILYNILGSAYQNIGDLKLAKETFLKGYKMEPKNIAIMNNLANVYKNIGEIQQSEDLFKKIIEKKPDYINAYVNYGNLKRDNNDFEFAIDLYNKALKINSQIPAVLYSLALAYQGLGKFELAIDYAKKTLEIEPKFTQADMLISQSKKYQAGDLHYEEMNLKINSLILNEEQKINLLFALAKAEEDMDLIKKSFNNFNIANSIRRKSLNFNINNETTFFNQLKNIFTKIDLSQKFINNCIDSNLIKIPKDKKDKVRKFISSMPRDYLIVLSEKIVPEILDEEESALKILGEKKRALTFPQLSETWGQSHQTWKNRQTEALKAVKTFLNKEKDDALHTQLLKIFINIFENEDFEDIRLHQKGIENLSARKYLQGSGMATYKNKTGNFDILGCLPGEKEAEQISIIEGRFVDHLDITEARKVACIGIDMKIELFGTDASPIGEYININGIPFKVIGFFSDQGGDRDVRRAWLPLSTHQKVFGDPMRVDRMVMTTGDATIEEADQIVSDLRTRLSQRLNVALQHG